MINVFFYHAQSLMYHNATKKKVFLGTASLYLKTYIDHNRPDIADKINWLLPEQHQISDEDLIQRCIDMDVDVLCTSHYTWNTLEVFTQLKRVADKLPKKIKILAGGPSIDAHVNPKFFEEYPFIDYAVYAAGEVAFSDIITSYLTGKKLIAFNTSNVTWFDKEKQKHVVADWKIVPQLKQSPYVSNEEYFTKIIKNEHSNGIRVAVPYDVTRGCPYSCTFCDWNGGFTNKVSRRKGSYIDEIDLFHKLKIEHIVMSDANVGQYDEDVDIIRYIGKKNIEENANFMVTTTLSKLNAKNNMKIFRALADGKMQEPFGFVMSVQEVNEEVLKNIARPGMGWETYSGMIDELHSEYPHKTFIVQLVQSIPGQTVESWKQTLATASKRSYVRLMPFMNELLPASPAKLDPEYQKNFKFVYSSSKRINDGVVFKGIFPESCVSFTKEDSVVMSILSTIYTAVSVYLAIRESLWKYDVDKDYIVDRFLESERFQILKDNLIKNWEEDNFYYTKNFDLENETGTACQFFDLGDTWSRAKTFEQFLIDSTNNEEFRQILIANMERIRNGLPSSIMVSDQAQRPT